jgi:DNA polymerase-1
MTSPERLFLLDGMALAYRAYFAFIARPLINSKGMNTSAIYGFVTTLMKILEEEKPDHCAVVFDTKEPTFRHVLFPDYKATRQKMPEDMVSQLDMLKDVVRAFRTPLIELPGYEADDVIGTLARRAEKEGLMTYMVTGDKDFMQLLSPSIRMYRPGKNVTDAEIVDEAGVRAKFGVPPDGVIEVLGLIGDKSDNVPGVPGIGEKTAIPLIQKYGTIPVLYEHLDDIPQKGVREKLANNREKAFLSRQLVTIDTNAPITVDIHELRVARRDTAALIRLFGELEFKSLAGRLRDTEPLDTSFDEPSPPPAVPETVTNISSDRHTYHCVTTTEELEKLCRRLQTSELVVFDTETTSTDPLVADLVGISLCMEEREAFYIPVRLEQTPQQTGSGLFSDDTTAVRHNHTAAALPRDVVLERLKPIFESERIRKAGQNMKYDMLVLRSHGVEVRRAAFDTMVAGYILRPDGQHSLDALAMQTLRYAMVSYDDLVGKGKNRKHITEVPLQAIADYSSEDADMTFRIMEKQRERLRELRLSDLCEQIEFPLVTVLAAMEWEGVALDVEYLRGMSVDLDRQIKDLVTAIHAAAGGEFNINSTQQLSDVLFTKLQLPVVRKTKTGFSTDVAVLEELQGSHPIVALMLDYRQLTKLKSTYIDALPTLINPRTKKVHTSFNQTVAATGRLSSSDPNLQNIPIRSEIGRSIRKAFVPGAPGHAILSADYSQIELRVMAHMSGDVELTAAFRNEEDIHATTAAKVFGVAAQEITRDMRRKAKEVNFGIIYGIGPFGLARRLEISQTEARTIIDTYFQRFPKVRQYINDTIAAARREGFVSTLRGRRRYLPDINSRNQNIRGNAERQAINMPIQGTAADMIKLAMVSLHDTMRARRLRSTMVLQVHDELVFDLVVGEREIMEPLVRELMQNAMPLSVPVKVDVGVGANWLEAH